MIQSSSSNGRLLKMNSLKEKKMDDYSITEHKYLVVVMEVEAMSDWDSIT